MIKRLLDLQIVKFGIVGVMNTALSWVVMFFLYNIMHVSDTISTLVAYILGSILSFILNRTYTFQSEASIGASAFKFTLNVAICYVGAYVIFKPFIKSMVALVSQSQHVIDNITMMLGSVVFTAINFIGQKYFTFKN
ncbi:hypothetical protein AOC36_02455 [Erysipelothrix larvae]|uniref:GtrA/DPMS transmembrane domain-containing protein n=1 Tax=Erysipelothrix larvae TaxID=1514105 RepID=A0A120JTH3_9FIRM|nr:GtrA family protein [Erysipelothrix larvae]AMC92883.1 hypothetical protein AOC36_02455 [Erysipelothrix larvae]